MQADSPESPSLNAERRRAGIRQPPRWACRRLSQLTSSYTHPSGDRYSDARDHGHDDSNINPEPQAANWSTPCARPTGAVPKIFQLERGGSPGPRPKRCRCVRLAGKGLGVLGQWLVTGANLPKLAGSNRVTMRVWGSPAPVHLQAQTAGALVPDRNTVVSMHVNPDAARHGASRRRGRHSGKCCCGQGRDSRRSDQDSFHARRSPFNRMQLFTSTGSATVSHGKIPSLAARSIGLLSSDHLR